MKHPATVLEESRASSLFEFRGDESFRLTRRLLRLLRREPVSVYELPTQIVNTLKRCFHYN